MSNTYEDIMKRREKEIFDAGFEAGRDSGVSVDRDLVDRSEALADGQSAAITSSYDYILRLEATIEQLKSYQANYEHTTQIERDDSMRRLMSVHAALTRAQHYMQNAGVNMDLYPEIAEALDKKPSCQPLPDTGAK